jgi:hypothetical protein
MSFNFSYVEDIPAANPQFDFLLVAKALTPLLIQKHEGAVVLGLHGPWGSGKTTVMDAIYKQILSELPEEKRAVVNFNAWKFQDRQALWRALILHVLGELRKNGGDEKKIEELEAALYRSFAVEEKGPWTVNWRTVIVEIISIGLSVLKLDFVGNALKKSTGWVGRVFFGGDDEKKGDKGDGVISSERVDKLASVLERKTIERHVQQVQSIEQFLEEFKGLIKKFTDDGRRVFVFIDDLDRCLPESALEIFEAIKLFLDAPGCAFVVALDRDVIRKALAVRYARQGEAALGQNFINPDEYIEKTISISFDVPRLSPDDAYELMKSFDEQKWILSEAQKNEQKDAPTEPQKDKQRGFLTAAQKKMIVDALGVNPRRVKRFMNNLAVQLNLAHVAKDSKMPLPACLANPQQNEDFDVFLKLMLISYRYSGVFAIANEDENLLTQLQSISNWYKNTSQGKNKAEARIARDQRLANELPMISSMRHNEEFWELIASGPDFTTHANTLQELQHWFRYKP